MPLSSAKNRVHDLRIELGRKKVSKATRPNRRSHLRDILNATTESLTLEDFVATREKLDGVAEKLRVIRNEVKESPDFRLPLDRRRIRVKRDRRRDSQDINSWMVDKAWMVDAADIRDENRITDLESYFAPLKLIVEAGSKPEEVFSLEPVEQETIASYLRKYPMSPAEDWCRKIDPALPELASFLAHAYYERSTEHVDIEKYFVSFFGRSLEVTDVKGTMEQNYEALNQLRNNKLKSCGIEDSKAPVYLPSKGIITGFVVMKAMLESSDKENEEVWMAAAKDMVSRHPSNTRVEGRFELVLRP